MLWIHRRQYFVLNNNYDNYFTNHIIVYEVFLSYFSNVYNKLRQWPCLCPFALYPSLPYHYLLDE